MAMISYIPHPITGQSTGYFERHIRGEHEPRVFCQVDQDLGAGSKKRIDLEVYYNPGATPPESANLPQFPINDGEGPNGKPASSINRWVNNGGSVANVYLTKPGWRYARAQDVIDVLKRGEANRKREAQDRADNTKEGQDRRQAEVTAEAMARALTKISGGKSSAQYEDEIMRLKEALALRPPASNGAPPLPDNTKPGAAAAAPVGR